MRGNLISKLALGLALVGLSGCQDAGRVVAPEVPGPSHSLVDGLWNVIDEANGVTGEAIGIFGSGGGKLTLGGHTLVIPAGAVDKPTTFTMTKASDEVLVSLTATQVTLNDIGSAGFAKPLTLTFSYSKATDLPSDLSTLEVIWIRTDGTVETQPTTLDTAAKVIHGQISHFSDYAMASS